MDSVSSTSVLDLASSDSSSPARVEDFVSLFELLLELFELLLDEDFPLDFFELPDFFELLDCASAVAGMEDAKASANTMARLAACLV